MSVLPMLLSLVLTSRPAAANNTFPCPAHCACSLELKFSSCSGANLTRLPAVLPPYTEHLNLSFNHLLSVGTRAFWAVRRLRALLLNDNRIGHLSDGAFDPLDSLVKLDLSRNNISFLPAGFSLGLFSLRELSLAENRLSFLEEHEFSHFDTLQKLDLSRNYINQIHVRAFSSLRSVRRIRLDHNRIKELQHGVFFMTRNLEELGLSGNNVGRLEAGVLSPLTSLMLLNLTNNNFTDVDFKAFLSLDTRSTHIQLRENPWTCNCELQRIFRKVNSTHRLQLDDYSNLTCNLPQELRGYPLQEVGNGLCFAETVTVLIITVTVMITVVAAIIMAEKKRKKSNKGKHWTEVSEVSCNSQN